jgi:hypothetical protein
MPPSATSCSSRDFLSSPLSVFALFWLPAIAILVTGTPLVSAGWRTAVWTLALTVMGIACIANASRCGRTHCYITGPFFLLLAAVTLLYGLGILTLAGNGWSPIGLTILVGAVALCCLPDLVLGKYRQGRTGNTSNSR